MSKAIQFDRNGETGNIFYILEQASRVLREQGRKDKAVEMIKRATQGDYENTLKVIGEYVELQDITYKPRYQPRTYEQLIQWCKDTLIDDAGMIALLQHYTNTLGWGMQASLDYVVGLFENGTIPKLKEIAKNWRW